MTSPDKTDNTIFSFVSTLCFGGRPIPAILPRPHRAAWWSQLRSGRPPGNLRKLRPTTPNQRPELSTNRCRTDLDAGQKPNNYRHIFKAKHKFDDLVEELGGEEAVMRMLLKGVTQLGITAGRYEACLVVLGRTVMVRGNVVDGVVRVGTAFVL